MAGYINLVLKKTKTKKLFIVQLLTFCGWLLIFVKYMPWITSTPINEYHLQEYAKPSWAKYYGTDHGTPYFFIDSPKENSLKFYSVIISFFSMYVFIITSMIYVYKINGLKFPWFRIKLYEKEN